MFQSLNPRDNLLWALKIYIFTLLRCETQSTYLKIQLISAHSFKVYPESQVMVPIFCYVGYYFEDFEEQSVTYSKLCLHELFSKMGQNRKICKRALRKQKQTEKEEAGMVSYIKVHTA